MGSTSTGVVAFWDTNTVLTSGWSSNHRCADAYHGMQISLAPTPMSLTASEKKQPEAVIEYARQWLRRATTSTAGRQCRAWLSPTSATVAIARAAGTPNVQTGSGCCRVSRQGENALSSRCVTPGVNERDGLKHGCCGSRAAAPKQRGVPAADAAAGLKPSASPVATAVASKRAREHRYVFCWNVLETRRGPHLHVKLA